MATQNRRGYSNPHGSADLGSGVRTTTGGTYRNPRLGIQDTTAFSRGFASTFRIPKFEEEEEKKDQLKIGDLSIPSEAGNEWFEKDGVINSLNSDLGVILNNNWKNDKEFGGAAYWQNIYETGNDQQKAMASNVLNGYYSAFGPKDSNFGKYLAIIGDGKLVDKEVSNVYLPGLDGRNTTLTLADISEASQNNPGRFKYAHEEYRGILRYGLKDSETGQFINVTAMDDAWIEDNIKDRYDIETSLAAGYENFQISKQNYPSFEEGFNLFAGTANEFKVKRTGDYYQTKDLASFDGIAADAAKKEVMVMVADDLMPSAFGQMVKKVNNGDFRLSLELYEQYSALNADDEDYEDNLREWRNAAVQDYYTEQFKLRNGSKYYSMDNRETIPNPNFDSSIEESEENPSLMENPSYGRAIARTKENKDFFERDYMKTERDISGDDSGSGSGSAFFNIFKGGMGDMEMPLVFGEKSAGKSLITGELGKDAYRKMFNVNAYNENDIRKIMKSTYNMSDKAINKQIQSYKDKHPNNMLWTLENDEFIAQPAIDGTLQGWANMLLSSETSPLSVSERSAFGKQFEAFKSNPDNEKFFRGDEIVRGNPNLIPPVPKSDAPKF